MLRDQVIMTNKDLHVVDAYPKAVAMRSNDDMLARLDSWCNGFSPKGHEALHCGLQGLCQGQVFRVVVGIPPVISWKPRVILALL